MTIFKAYDIRGIYGENLTEKESYLIGYYLSKYLDLKEFKVAHDLRLSHEQLTKYFLRGLMEGGCRPIYLGSLSTPNFYYSLFEGINSGVVITASHNASQYNGFKIIHHLESFDSRNGLLELGKLVEEDLDSKTEDFNQLNLENITLEEYLSQEDIETQEMLKSYISFLENYAKHLFTSKELEILKERRFAFCFSSGMSSQALVPLLSSLEINHIFHLENPDGSFPEFEPDPTKAQQYIIDSIDGVELTFAYDGDGDRLVVYDEEQMFVLEDYLISSFIDYFKLKNSNFVVDLRASKSLFDLGEENNLTIESMRVGRAFYQTYMKEHECIFGAELSGHLFFEDFHYLDNPDIATLIFLKIMSRNFIHNHHFRASELFNSFKNYHKLPEKNIKVKDKEEAFSNLKDKYKENLVSELDGLSFDLGDVWFNVRASNTEPVLRINLEGESENLASLKLDDLVSYLEN